VADEHRIWGFREDHQAQAASLADPKRHISGGPAARSSGDRRGSGVAQFRSVRNPAGSVGIDVQVAIFLDRLLPIVLFWGALKEYG